jgi:putative membrane protein
MRRVSIIAAVLIVASSMAFAQKEETSKVFLTEAIEGNFAEIQMGELAQKNAQNEGVRSFGQTLVDDHGKANKKALELAKSMGVTPPTGPNAKHKAASEKIAKRTGSEFDREFVQHMAQEHKNDIAKYRKQAKLKDAVGQYAEETLPVLEKHLDITMDLQKTLSKK